MTWRQVDVDQQALDNARVMWQRFVEKNRRSVEEHSEQLKSLANLSALVAGFSVIGFLEFQFQEEDYSHFVPALYGLFTALTVSGPPRTLSDLRVRVARWSEPNGPTLFALGAHPRWL